MRNRLVVLAVVLFCGVAAQRPYAEDEVLNEDSVMGLSLKASTLGYGMDLTFGLAPEINTRLGFNMFNYEPDVGDDDDEEGAEEINVELDWQTITAFLDWHPWAENFRFTLGAVVNNNEVLLSANIGESVEINDQTYTVSDLGGKVTFDPVVPYLGIGYGNAVRGGRVKFAFDLGVVFQGEPEVELNATASDPGLQALLQEAVNAEKAEIQDDLDAFTLYPLLSFGISFVF